MVATTTCRRVPGFVNHSASAAITTNQIKWNVLRVTPMTAQMVKNASHAEVDATRIARWNSTAARQRNVGDRQLVEVEMLEIDLRGQRRKRCRHHEGHPPRQPHALAEREDQVDEHKAHGREQNVSRVAWVVRRGFQQQAGHQVHARRKRVEVVEGFRQPIAKVERIGHPHPVETEREPQSGNGQRHAREDEYQAEEDVGHVRAPMMDRFCDTKQHAVFAARDPPFRYDRLRRHLHPGRPRRPSRRCIPRRRPPGGDARRASRAARPAPPAASASPSSIRPSVIARTAIRVEDARAGRFTGSDIPGRPAAPVDPGHRPRRQAARAARSRASATSPTRCCRAPTAGCSTARTRSASCRRCRSTTSAT